MTGIGVQEQLQISSEAETVNTEARQKVLWSLFSNNASGPLEPQVQNLAISAGHGRTVPCQRSQQSMSSESWSLWRCCNGATEHILHISIPCGNQKNIINLHSLIVLLQHMTYVAWWNYSAEFCSGSACFISGSMVITGYSLLLMESSEGTRCGSLELKQKVMAPTGSASSPHHFVCTLLLCLQWWKRTTSTDTLNLTGKS